MNNDSKSTRGTACTCCCHDDPGTGIVIVAAPPAEPEPESQPRRLRGVSVGFIAAALGFAGDFTKGPTPPRENHRKKSQAPFRRGGRG